ncbi:S41 family peptidase [Ruminococcus sp.]|uniref:S41 family peptidase n=1 Tax=Ruminococcus sp. TaxID=41978 RepID=UPI0025EE936F|nr:S41 family peptidase [Ruminococcus sp.]
MKLDYSKIINGFFLSCAAAGIAYLGFIKYYEKELKFCEDYSQLINVNKDVEKTYYKDIDKVNLEYDMIDGLINGLDDRFSCYDSMKKVNEACVNVADMLKTNGFQVGQDEKTKRMVITEVTPNSIAEKQGMSAGDYIIAIDDTVIYENGYHNSIELLLGNKDTALKLICSHEGKNYEVIIKRGVKADYETEHLANKMYDNGIYYYHLSGFELSSAASFELEIDEFRNDIKGLIIDLRDNGGGVTEEVVKLFDLFYGAGCSVKTVYEKSGKVEIYETSDGVKYDFPVVLLVSEKSLSSSEILAAFVQDTGRGTVVGTVTGGKGVFQRATELEDCSTYYIVAGYYYVNDLPNYDGVGITPDIIVEMDPELIGTDDDIQLKKAIELLS